MYRTTCPAVLVLAASISVPALPGEVGSATSTTAPLFGGMVTNASAPMLPGTGVEAVWSYGGEIGTRAGDEMCAAIEAHHVCTFEEVLAADAAGELDGIVPAAQTFWLHRVALPVPTLGGPGTSPAGTGGRCNDWTYPTNHVSDGEFGQFQPQLPTPANAQRIGNVDFYTDDDTVYTGTEGDGHQCVGVADAVEGTPGCAGHCGGAIPKAILCCNRLVLFADGFETGSTSAWSGAVP